MNKKVHLNETVYFGDDGAVYATLKEARANSKTTLTVRKQNCSFAEFAELTDEQKVAVEDIIENTTAVAEETISVISNKGKVLFVSNADTLTELINLGIFSDIE